MFSTVGVVCKDNPFFSRFLIVFFNLNNPETYFKGGGLFLTKKIYTILLKNFALKKFPVKNMVQF